MMKYVYTKSFYIGFGVGVFLTLLIGFLVLRTEGSRKVEGMASTQPTLSPSTLFKVIPETAKTGDQIIIRGNRFAEKGKVCFTSCDTQFEVISWSRGAIVAKVNSASTSGDLWIVDGKGGETNHINFIVE